MAKQYPFRENFKVLSEKCPTLVRWITEFDLAFSELPDDVVDDLVELERALELREAVEKFV